jgi:hypothetical protein
MTYAKERARALRWCLVWRYQIEAPALVREWQNKLLILRRWHYKSETRA